MRARVAILFLLLFFSTGLRADILLIINADNSMQHMERKQIVDLFMGRVTAFPNGWPAETFDLRSGTPLRSQFYRALTGKSEAQVDAYWATLIFAGRMSPPKQFASEQALIKAVAQNPHAIAYVTDKRELPSSVKVVMKLKSHQ